MQIYVDNSLVYTAHAATLNTSLVMSSGSHFVVVQAWDSTGAVFKSPVTITVSPSGGGGSCTAAAAGVTVCSPVQGASSGSPVHVVAAAKAAGIDFPVHAHMLRHATGFYLANAGQDTRAIQLYLGHKNIQHTVRYTELSPQRFKDFWKD